MFYYSKHSKESELIYGIDIGNDLNKKEGQINYNGALYIRNNDAIIPQVGIMFQDFSFHISYDINTSELSKASNNYGGLEFSVIYSWNTKNKKQKNTFKCPKYL